MPPAATMGDLTSHGTPLGPGTPPCTVFIGGKPAWRAGIDNHLCPLSDGPKPHIGGLVMLGSKTVLVNNFPLARQGDIIMEAGIPNTIISGVLTVIVGG